MSRVGKKPIEIPTECKVEIAGGQVQVQGPGGVLSFEIPGGISVVVADGKVKVERKNNEKIQKSLHGLVARQIKNMLIGVTTGWSKTLELVGTGYRAQVLEEKLILAIGFSHPVEVSPPPGIKLEVAENKIRVSGPDRHLVGQVAANIRQIRPPEPYKGKGIKYEDENVRRKPGKAVKTGPMGGMNV